MHESCWEISDNFPNVMVLVCNTMIDEEIWLALFRILLGISCLLMHVNQGKIRNFPSSRENYRLNHLVRTKETEAIMVLLNNTILLNNYLYYWITTIVAKVSLFIYYLFIYLALVNCKNKNNNNNIKRKVRNVTVWPHQLNYAIYITSENIRLWRRR